MVDAEGRLKDLGIILPPRLKLPPNVVLNFPMVQIRNDRAYISGHGPQSGDGSFAGPFGRVGDTVTPDQARQSARLVGLSILGSLQRELGSLNRITGWCRILGMVNCAPGFRGTPAIIDGFTELIIEIFGTSVGAHSRSAVGVAELPFDIPVEIEGEVLIQP